VTAGVLDKQMLQHPIVAASSNQIGCFPTPQGYLIHILSMLSIKTVKCKAILQRHIMGPHCVAAVFRGSSATSVKAAAAGASDELPDKGARWAGTSPCTTPSIQSGIPAHGCDLGLDQIAYFHQIAAFGQLSIP